MPKFDSTKQGVKARQAYFMAKLQKELAENKTQQAAEVTTTKQSHLRAQRALFLSLLIETRRAQKLSQYQLAKQVGMPQPAIARLESGRGNPSLDMLLKIAEALGVNLVLE